MEYKINYSVEQFCSTFDISKPTFYDLLKKDLITTYKIGSRRMISHEAAVEFQRKMEAMNNAA